MKTANVSAVKGRGSRLPAGTAAALTVTGVLLVLAGRYELHGDELYFRLLPAAWWYEDQPPLTVWLTQAAKLISEAAWVQRVPAALAAGAGALVAAAFPKALGHGREVQSIAAWAHASTVYPLIVTHLFLTSTIDLLVWMLVVLGTVKACLGNRAALVWAGAVAGAGMWNKLLIVPLLGAFAGALLLTQRRLLLSRQALLGGALAVALGAPQLLAQAVHGWPMARVSGELISGNGGLNRALVLPLLVAFVGPPLFGVALRGLSWRPDERSGWGILAPAGITLVAWNLWAPAQPYYAVALFCCATAIGWGLACDTGAKIWRQRQGIVAANAVVAVIIALPVLPIGSVPFEVAARINPAFRDQVGWTSLVRQVDAARQPGMPVITDAYSLAGALDYYGDVPVASGHNALWRLGPPHSQDVLLVGERGRALASQFVRCEEAGRLRAVQSDPFRLSGSPMMRCHHPVGGWEVVWPRFRHLGG